MGIGAHRRTLTLIQRQMQAGTTLIKNRLACDRGSHASSSLGFSKDGARGPTPLGGAMAGIERPLFTQKAWQKSSGNVAAYSGGIEEGVDHLQEACF